MMFSVLCPPNVLRPPSDGGRRRRANVLGGLMLSDASKDTQGGEDSRFSTASHILPHESKRERENREERKKGPGDTRGVTVLKHFIDGVRHFAVRLCQEVRGDSTSDTPAETAR